MAEVQFSSEIKWGALAFELAERRGTFVLGASEMLEKALGPGSDSGNQAKTWSE